MIPPAPKIALTRDQDRPNKIRFNIAREKGAAASRYAIWSLNDDKWRLAVEFAGDDSVDRDIYEAVYDELAGLPELIVVTAVDRTGNESERVRVTREQLQAAKELVWRK